MKILHIANFGNSGPGGIRTVVENLVREQLLLKEDVRVCLTMPHEEFVNRPNYFYTCDFKSFKSIIKDWRPDIVIFHAIFNTTFYLFSLYFKLHCIPYGIVMHGAGTPASLQERKFKKKVAIHLFVNRFIRKANALFFLCKGEESRNHFAKKNKRHYIVPNGINEVQSPYVKNLNNRIRFIFIGRIVYSEKALDILEKVFAIIKEKEYGDLMTFSFYGPLYDDLPTMLIPFSEFAEWCGPVYGDDKIKAYKDADIFMLISRSEGMPMGVLESLSCGTPCLVSPQTNMGDLIIENDCGWVTSLEPEEIVNSINTAIDDVIKRQSALLANSLNAVKDYTWQNIAKLTISDYKEIIQIGSCRKRKYQ